MKFSFIAGIAAAALTAGIANAQSAAPQQLAQAERELREAAQRLAGDVRNTDAQLAPGQAAWALRRIERVLEAVPADRREAASVVETRREVAEAWAATVHAGTARPDVLRAEIEGVIAALPSLRQELGLEVPVGNATAPRPGSAPRG